MKKTRHTEEQIAFALKQAETGTPVAEVIRRMGISEQTFYRWKKVYDGLGVGELRRLKLLEDENRKLKQLVADLSLDKHIVQDVLAKSPDAWTTARDRRARPGVAWCQRATRLPGTGRRPVVGALRVALLTQMPRCCEMKIGRTAWASYMWPIRLVSITRA